MGIYYDSNKKAWYVRIRITLHDGTKKRLQRGFFKTKKEAKEEEIKLLYRLETTDMKEKMVKSITFDELAILYLDYKKSRIKPSTYATLKSCINGALLPCFKGMKLNKINIKTIESFQSNYYKKYKSHTFRGYESNLKAMFNFAVKHNLMKQNPYTNIDLMPLKSTKEIIYFTFEQFKKFMSYVENEEFKDIFTILYYTGLRFGEFQALKFKDLHLTGEDDYIFIHSTYNRPNRIVIESTKTGKDRIVLLNDVSIEILKKIKNEAMQYGDYTDEWFIFGKYTPITYFKCCRIINRTIELYNSTHEDKLPNIRLHGFRHSHASFLINAGVNSFVIAERLGHSRQMLEKTYAHLFHDSRKSALLAINNLQSL